VPRHNQVCPLIRRAGKPVAESAHPPAATLSGPGIDSDGIHDTLVTDDSMCMPAPRAARLPATVTGHLGGDIRGST